MHEAAISVFDAGSECQDENNWAGENASRSGRQKRSQPALPTRLGGQCCDT
jgi:hypothetical protein